MLSHIPCPWPEHQHRTLINIRNAVNFTMNCAINVVKANNLIFPCRTVPIIKINLNKQRYKECSHPILFTPEFLVHPLLMLTKNVQN